MRNLTDTLRKAQEAAFKKPLVRLVLSYAEDSYTYTKTRILDIKETGDGSLQSAEIVLDNNDGALSDLDVKGHKAVLSYGLITRAGEEYSDLPLMWVIPQRFDSTPDKLQCVLSLVGIFNLLADDKASETYMPDEEDTKSVKTLVNEILGATLACFSHCTAYDVVWETGYDTLADSYQPKDGFRVYIGNNRLSAVNRLLEFTQNVAVAKADGKVHIFKPKTTGTTYDSEYSLQDGHPFFAKAYRNRLVIPNYIKVQSRDDDDPKYSGTAQDSVSFARLPKYEFKTTRLDSNDQAQAIAEAMLAKSQMWCEAGSAEVPLNLGTECFDYVRVTDTRQGDQRTGNIGRYTRHYNVTKNEWRMTFVFGNWQTVRKALANLGVTSDDVENYFSRLSVKNLYAENLLAKNMGFYWLDPDNTIDLSKVGTLDDLPDGEQYARVSTWNLSLDEDPESETYGLFILKLDEHTVYQPGYDPSSKRRNFTTTPTTPYDLGDLWVDGTVTKTCTTARATGAYQEADWLAIPLDAIADGTTFHRVKSAALSADGLVLLDQVVAGTYGLVLTTDISAGHILLSSVVQSSSYRTTSDTEKATWDGKEVAVHRGTTAPADTSKLWLDTSVTPNVWKRWTGTAWVKATPSEATEIAETAARKWAAETGADVTGAHPDAIVYYDSVAPAHKAGRLWYDTGAKEFKRSTGSAWQVVGDPTSENADKIVFYCTVDPGHKVGRLWFDCNVHLMKRSTGDVWQVVDPDMDSIPSGSTYSKVLTTSISAGKIRLDEVVQYTSYQTVTGTQKTSWTAKPENMDQIGEGSTYQRVRATQIDAGNLKLTSATVKSGEWYNLTGVLMDATKGIRLYGTDMAFGTFANVTDARAGTNWQTKMGSDGKIYAGAGNIRLDSSGIRVSGGASPAGYIDFYAGTTLQGWMCVSNTGVFFLTKSGGYMEVGAQGTGSQLQLDAGSGGISMAAPFLDLPRGSSHPTGVEGRMYFRTSDNTVWIYLQAKWRTFTVSS